MLAACGLGVRAAGLGLWAGTRQWHVLQTRWDEGVGYLERETFDAFLQLPAPQRKLIREVILTFAKVHGTEAARQEAATESSRPD